MKVQLNGDPAGINDLARSLAEGTGARVLEVQGGIILLARGGPHSGCSGSTEPGCRVSPCLLHCERTSLRVQGLWDDLRAFYACINSWQDPTVAGWVAYGDVDLRHSLQRPVEGQTRKFHLRVGSSLIEGCRVSCSHPPPF